LANKNGKKRSVFSLLIHLLSLFVALLLVAIAVTFGIFIHFNSPAKNPANFIASETDAVKIDDDGSYLIDVRRGETSQSVGMRLERTGLISSRHFWNILCRLSNEHIKTGTYRVVMPQTMLSIYRLLISGREVLRKVTIPEGVTLKKTSRMIEEAGICSAKDFLAAAYDPAILRKYGIQNPSMEGYLFPDTYLFPGEYPAQQTIIKMADNFYKKLESISPSYKNLSAKELNEKIILASIVEREYRIAQEASLMAGVFYNRLRIGMALQSCATVEYIITEIQGRPHPNVLLFQDLEIINPYNTYLYPGLPPGPISAPGVVALRAVMYPETTGYLYFRLEDAASGRHYFSRTHDEHIRAGQLYIKPSWR
jgi:UPF0755 protein